MKVKNLMGNTSTDSLGTDHGDSTRELTGVSTMTKQKDMQVEYIQPWSNVIVKFKIPDEIFEDLEKMYNSVMLNDKQYFGDRLVGQIEEELYVNPELLEKHIMWKDFCIQSVKNYYTNSQKQVHVGEQNSINLVRTLGNELHANIASMWFVNQKPNEYNPLHVHTGCRVSALAYLKKPKNQLKSRKEFYLSDGKITFSNNCGTDTHFSSSNVSFEPEPGDMYIFTARQNHCVWPYRSSDPEDLRTSISLNVEIMSDVEANANRKQFEDMFKQKIELEENKKILDNAVEKHKQSEVKDDKSTTDGDINKSG